MKCYRLLTGSVYDAKTDSFVATIFHMRFYASDRNVLMYLITVAGAPSGRVIDADQVLGEDNTPPKYPPKKLPN